MDTDVLAVCLVAALIIMRLIEALLKPVFSLANMVLESLLADIDPEMRAAMRRAALREFLKQWPGWVATAVGYWLATNLGLNAFPIFGLVGGYLTALAVALGPSFIYDLMQGPRQEGAASVTVMPWEYVAGEEVTPESADQART